MRLHIICAALNGLLMSAALSPPSPFYTTLYFKELCDACNDAAKRGNDSVIAAIYQSKEIIVYKYNECIPYILNNEDKIVEGYLCQQANCTMFTDNDRNCTGHKVKDPVPFLAGEIYYDAAHFESVAIHSATCERTAMSIKIELPTCTVPSIVPGFRNV